MAENSQCSVEGCSYESFKTPQALRSHIRSKHPELPGNKSTARKVPIVEVDFATAELVGGKRRDIMKKASYGVCDKLALR